MQITAEEVTRNTLVDLLENPDILQQQNLYISWVNGDLTVDEYIALQDEIDNKTPKGQIYDWNKLKVENPTVYEHELAHKLVLDKYGVESQLYKLSKNCFCVSDVNLNELIKTRQYTAKQIINLQIEMVSASLTNKKAVSPLEVSDILQYEILSGNIKQINYKNVINIFSKYKWLSDEFQKI